MLCSDLVRFAQRGWDSQVQTCIPEMEHFRVRYRHVTPPSHDTSQKDGASPPKKGGFSSKASFTTHTTKLGFGIASPQNFWPGTETCVDVMLPAEGPHVIDLFLPYSHTCSLNHTESQIQ